MRKELTDDLVEELLRYVAEGYGVLAFCREYQVTKSWLFHQVQEDASLKDRIARARLAACVHFEDEILEIVDSATPETVHVAKLRTWAREKKLIWNMPERYGQKVQVGGAAGLPPVQLSVEERAQKVRVLLDRAKARREKAARKQKQKR